MAESFKDGSAFDQQKAPILRTKSTENFKILQRLIFPIEEFRMLEYHKCYP